MRLLTFIDMGEINAYEVMMQQEDYIPNTVQKRLAEEVTLLVHGKAGLETALKVTKGASPGSNTVLDAEILESISSDMASASLSQNSVIGQKLVDIMVEVRLQTSKSEARRLVRNGGVYLNNEKILDENKNILEKDLIDGRLILIATGKKNKILIRIER